MQYGFTSVGTPINDFVYAIDIAAYPTPVSEIEQRTPAMQAVIYLFEVHKEFATKNLSDEGIADLWLIQEQLDEVVSHYTRPGQWVGWIDVMKKNPLQPEVNASALLSQALKKKNIQLASLACTNDFLPMLFLHPYPLDVADESLAKQVQEKLIKKYEKELNATPEAHNLMSIHLVQGT